MAGNNTSQAVQLTAKQKIDKLKSVLDSESVFGQFKDVLKENAGSFVASLIELYNGDAALQTCEQKLLIGEALKAASLKLPINKALGFAYIVCYKNKVCIDGQWVKVPTPTFILGYKGLIQLALRTGQYRTINADIVYEGELRKVNKLTGEIDFDGEKKSDKVIGYFCHFELLNGFSKTFYMTVEQVATHAKKYSKGLKEEITVKELMGLSELPVLASSKAVGWLGNFNGMGLKTVSRLLLSKYGYLSVEMQTAIAKEVEAENYEDKVAGEINDNSGTMDVGFEEVKEGEEPGVGEPAQETEVKPSFA